MKQRVVITVERGIVHAKETREGVIWQCPEVSTDRFPNEEVIA